MNWFDKLPKFLPFFPKSQESEYFFAINIEPSQVTGAIWGVDGKKLHLVSTATSPYQSEDDLIEAANLSLDEALANFQPEPTKVLFGVPDSWLQDDVLKEDRLKLLQKLIKELDISPLAYVSTTSAVCHLLQKEQGVPTTAVLVQVADPLTVAVVKGGKIVALKEQKRSANLPDDIEKILLSFSGIEVLPSKILLYGSGNLNKYQEELTSFSWMSQLPFLHLPKIETLDQTVTIEAICLAGAAEINPEVVYQPGETASQIDLVQPAKKDLSELGFVAGDIASQRKPDEVKADWSDEVSAYPDQPRAVAPVTPPEEYEEEIDQDMTTGGGLPERIRRLWQNLWQLLSQLLGRGGKKTLIIPMLVLILIIAGLVLLPKAKVTVFIEMQVLERDTQVVADPNIKQVDEVSKKIPGKIVETEVTGSSKASATGKKQVGDPAKGKVIIYNKTTSPKSLSSGTILVGSNNIKFNLDTSVQIASQSSQVRADFTTIITPGRTESVGATALSIGPEGNIAAGSELSVNGSSTDQLVAKVDQAFSGGVSRDVTVVTSDDQNKLLAQLASELRKKAQEQIQTKLAADLKVLEEGLSEQIAKKSFSKNINDQAQEFSLSLTVRFKGVAYSESDLKLIVSKLVETNVPAGFELDLTQTETQADVAKVDKDGKLVFLAKFRAKLKPKLEKEQLQKELVGKTPDQAAAKLKEVSSVIGSDIQIVPSIPIKALQRLPLFASNIEIEVAAK